MAENQQNQGKYYEVRGLRFQIPHPKNPITNWRKTKISIWEFIGTFILAYGICQATNSFFVAVSLLAALLITVPFSGGHLNSGVSLAFLLKQEIDLFEFIFRIIAQFLGAFLGGFFSFVVTNSMSSPQIENYYAGGYEDGENFHEVYGPIHATIAECLGSFILVFGVLVMTDSRTTLYTGNNKLVNLFVISIIFFIARGTTPRTGGNLNPAIGPALSMWQSWFDGTYHPNSPFLVLFLGPYLGATIAAIYYRLIYLPLTSEINLKDNFEKVKESLRNVNQNQRKISGDDLEMNDNKALGKDEEFD